MKDLGDVSLNLGMQVSRDRLNDTLDISRGNYVKAVLQRYGCVDGRSVSTPGAGKPLYLKFGTLLDDGNKLLYQETVGSIIYLSTCTRWDHCLLRNAANSGDEQSEGWTYGGYSDTLRERRISVWGTRKILRFTDNLMLATETSWSHRTRSSYLLSRQQISWRTTHHTTRSWRPSWTR